MCAHCVFDFFNVFFGLFSFPSTAHDILIFKGRGCLETEQPYFQDCTGESLQPELIGPKFPQVLL